MDANKPQWVGHKPEIATAAPRDPKVSLSQSDARDACFVEALAQQHDWLASVHAVQPPVPIVQDGRHNGRIVFESRVLQNRDGPLGDGETRRAVAADGLPGQVLEISL